MLWNNFSYFEVPVKSLNSSIAILAIDSKLSKRKLKGTPERRYVGSLEDGKAEIHLAVVADT
jgi:hypothetical protein